MSDINVGIENHNLFVVVEGRGTAEYCTELNSSIIQICDAIEIKNIYIDSQKSSYMDSSFIGLILCWKKRYASKSREVSLLNPSDKIVDIFQNMGLESFIPSIYDKNIYCHKCSTSIHKKTENTIADIKLLLESHQNIMETSSENHKRFALVEKVFQKELQQKQYHH